MAIAITVEAIYRDEADRLFAEAIQLSELKQAMKRIARYSGLPDEEIREGATYTADITLWGLVTTRGHVMHVERLDRAVRRIQSREHNPRVRRWDHTLTIESHHKGALWRDHVVIDAGWQTPVTARMCRHVYCHRHKARHALSLTSTLTRV